MVAVLAVGVYMFTRMDDEIRRHVEQTLAEHFPHLNVSVGGARLVEGRGIAIYNLTVSETSSTRLQNNLLVVDEVMVYCDVQLSKLVKGKSEVRRVVVRHPQVWATRLAGGHWNLESLLPLPPCGATRPQIDIKNAQIVVSDATRPELADLSLNDVNLTVLAAEVVARDKPFEIRGTLGGPGLRQVAVRARFDPTEKLLHAEADLNDLQISKKLLAWVTAYSPSAVGPTTLQGVISGAVEVQHRFEVGSSPQVKAQLHVTEGRLDDSRLPWAVTELSCLIHCENETIKVEQLQANVGAATMVMQLEHRGWSSESPLALGMRIENLPLSKKLYRVLPSMLRKEWDKFRPTGVVDADLQITFDGKRWRPSVTLTGRELAFESDKFRYRLQDGSGKLSYKTGEEGQPAQLDIHLIGHGGGQPLEIVGQVFDPSPGARGWVNITGQNVVIEPKMIAALPDKTQAVIESLHPQGKFNVAWRLERTQQGQVKPSTTLQLDLVDCRVNYEKFPYPLRGIYGVIEAKDQDWTFRNLASGGSRRVFCEGYLRPLEVGKELSLKFTGEQIPLDDDLRQALPPAVRKAWAEMNPVGRVNFDATVLSRTGFAKPLIGVSIKPVPESATLQPRFFPYLLEKVAGKFDYQDGQLLLSGLSARHGRTTIRTNGSGHFRPDGSWDVELAGLSVDRLEPRRELLAALPPKLQKLVEQLRPTGSFSLNNTTLQFSRASGFDPAIATKWDTQLNCFQSNLQTGIDVKNIHGSIRLIGENTERGSHTAGELALDTATFQEVQFTNIRGPMWIDENRCLLGQWATEKQQLPARHLSAQVYDGSVESDAWVTFDGVPRYSATVSLRNADLLRVVRERFQGDQNFTGRVAANLTLAGQGRSQETMVGTGEVNITEANIYELPILVGLLKVLRSETPTSTAFNESDVRFRIEGRHIYLDQLDFIGDAVSLLGQGETNFDQELNLAFHSVVGRNEIRLPFVKNFVNQVGQQTMQMYVDGTLADPQVHTQALPGINHLIQQIRTDLDSEGTPPPTREAKRGFSLLPRWGKQ